MNVQNSTMVPLTRSGSLLTRQYISFSEQRAGRERLTLILRGVERLSPDEIEEGNIIFDLVFRDAEQLTMIGRTTQMPAFRKPWNTANTDPSPSMRRPVDVKAHFCFFLSVSLFPFSQAASVAILPSALFVSDIRSVQGGCSHSVGAAT